MSLLQNLKLKYRTLDKFDYQSECHCSKTKFVVLKDMNVYSGKTAPWFGESGNGVQYRTEKQIKDLLGTYLSGIKNEH